MKKSEKRLICIVLALSVAVSVFSICFNALAKSQKLILNMKYSTTTEGSEDLNWYVFTPEASGTYTFLSFNRPHSEAYLFTKESDASKTQKTMTQLAYSQSSPNYEERGQENAIQFCLTYHLDAGVTYYYSAGWWSADRTSGSFTVQLVCDQYDSSTVESVELSSDVSYDENTNGYWETDSNGQQYFRYSLSKLLTNMKVTVHYTDGTSSTVVGKDEIDGHSITYSENQSKVHWYPKGNENYTSNAITVTVLGVSTKYEVAINETGLFSVQLRVVDYTTGNALKDISVTRGSDTVKTADDGSFKIYVKHGENKIVLSGANAISREITINLQSTVSVNDESTTIKIITGDYNSDGIINGKDYAYIMKNFSGSEKDSEAKKFKKQVNFSKNNYDALTVKL